MFDVTSVRRPRSVIGERRYERIAAGLHPGGGAIGEGRVEAGSSVRDAVLGGRNGDSHHQQDECHLQGIKSLILSVYLTHRQS